MHKLPSGRTLILHREVAAQAILEYNLYVPGWCLRQECVEGNIRKAAFYAIGGEFVGVCCEVDGACYTVATFIQEKYRRMGIGSLLLSLIKTEDTIAAEGVVGSIKFYRKNKVPLDFEDSEPTIEDFNAEELAEIFV